MMSVVPALLVTASGLAQTNATQATYSTRIEKIGRNDAAAAGAKVNGRLNTRINTRVDTRLVRERDIGASPTAAFIAARERLTEPVAPVPPAVSMEDDGR